MSVRTRIAGLVILFSLFSPQKGHPSTCSRWLAAPRAAAAWVGRVALPRPRLGFREFRALQAKRVAESFTAEPVAGERARFYAEMNLCSTPSRGSWAGSTSIGRSASGGARDATRSSTGWRSKSSGAKGITLGQLGMALHVEFTDGRREPGLAARAKRILSPRGMARMSWAASKLIVGTFLGLTFIGPAADIFRATFYSLTHIVAETASQKGTQWLEPAASWLQWTLSDPTRLARAKEDLKDAKEDVRRMEAMVDTLDALTPQQAKERWEKLEEGFFLFYLRYNQKLPSHLHEGRWHAKDNIADKLMASATALAIFDNQYETHRRALRELDERPALTATEAAERRRHAEQMEAAQERIAAALANQKLYDIMYSDFSEVPEEDKARVPLTRAYESFYQGFRFDLYMKEYSRNMRLILARMGVQVARFESELGAAGR